MKSNLDVDEYIESFRQRLNTYADREVKLGAEAYMRHKFPFVGVKAPQRKEVIKSHLAEFGLPPPSQVKKYIRALWDVKEREYQYFGMDLCYRLVKHADQTWIRLFEFIIQKKSWWDTVDYIAVWPVARFFKSHRNTINETIPKWLKGDDMWLKRTCLLFQMKYKEDTDLELLKYCIEKTKDSKEFFLRKAIGWSLREYSKTNPNWVIQYVNSEDLSPLSKREALKRIKRSAS